MSEVRRRLPLIGILLLIPGVFIAWYWWMRFGALSVATAVSARAPSPPASGVGMAELGQSGDMFGGLSAAFSALAFVGVAIAAYFQKVSADLQAAQLADAREATKRAEADAYAAREMAVHQMERAEHQSSRQSFEPLFFKLVELLRSQSNSTELNAGTRAGAQMLSFHHALGRLRGMVARTFSIEAMPDTPAGWIDRVLETYLVFYHINESQLGPYFRLLYNALKLIDKSRLPDAEQVTYANILRALLSRDELLLLMLNCCSPYGQKMKRYVNDFGLLQHVSRQERKDTKLDSKLLECFEPTAVMSMDERLEYWSHNPKINWKVFRG